MIDLKDVLFHLINLCVLFLGIRFFAYKPIVKALDARKKRFSDEREEIDGARAEAASDKAVYENMISIAQGQAEKLQHMRLAQAEEQAAAIIDDAKKQAERIVADARARMAAEESTTRDRTRIEIVDLSITLAQRILQREVSPQDNHRIIDEFLQKVE